MQTPCQSRTKPHLFCYLREKLEHFNKAYPFYPVFPAFDVLVTMVVAFAFVSVFACCLMGSPEEPEGHVVKPHGGGDLKVSGGRSRKGRRGR